MRRTASRRRASGNHPRATRVLERELDLCRTWQIVVGIAPVAAALGAAYALAGRADEALPLVAGAVEEFRRRQNHISPAFILLCAGTTYVSAGRIDEAAIVKTRRQSCLCDAIPGLTRSPSTP